MSKHTYRVTVEHLGEGEGQVSRYPEPLQFEVTNHDDLFFIVPWVQERTHFDEATTKAFVVGMKLFGEVMLKNKRDPLFAELYPEFLEFMKKLKSSERTA